MMTEIDQDAFRGKRNVLTAARFRPCDIDAGPPIYLCRG